MLKSLSRHVRQELGAVRAGIAYRAGADVAARAASLVVIVVAARTLTREAFGVLALGLATGWLAGVVTDLGLPMVLAREAARRGAGRLGPVVAPALRLRLAAAGVGWVAAAGIGSAWIPAPYGLAFALVVLAQVGGSVAEAAGHVFRGLGRLDVDARVLGTQRVASAAGATAALWMTASLTTASLAMAIPAVFGAGVMIALARRASGPSGPPSVAGADAEYTATRLIRSSAPLGVGAVLSALYFRADVYFLEYWRGLDAVAGYSAAFRVFQALRILPAAVLAAVFPAMCRATSTATVIRLTAVLGSGAAVLALVMAGTAPAVIALLYGSRYGDAAPVLVWLAPAVPLGYANYALTCQVVAWDGERAYAAVMAAAFAVSLAVNAWLVPTYGMHGAAASTWATELTVTAGCLVALRRRRRVRVPAAVERLEPCS